MLGPKHKLGSFTLMTFQGLDHHVTLSHDGHVTIRFAIGNNQ